MVKTGYQEIIYKTIDLRAEVSEKFDKLTESSNDDFEFRKIGDGSIAVEGKYRDHVICINLNEYEIFKYVLEQGEKVGTAIEEIIKNKINDKFLKEMINC